MSPRNSDLSSEAAALRHSFRYGKIRKIRSKIGDGCQIVAKNSFGRRRLRSARARHVIPLSAASDWLELQPAQVKSLLDLKRPNRICLFARQPMHIRRTLLVLLIALSVATMPTRGVVALGINPTEITASATIPGCCDSQDMPCEKSVNGCPLMALCASTSVGLMGASFSDFAFPLVATDEMPSLTSFGLDSQLSNPPFRPPRI